MSQQLPNETGGTLNLEKLRHQVLTAESQLKSEYPQQADLILAALNERLLTPPAPVGDDSMRGGLIIDKIDQTDQKLNSNAVSTEEKQAILDKLAVLGRQPLATSADELLYLEQQLSDWLNLDIDSSHHDIALPHNQGMIAALPHLKQSPTDSLTKKPVLKEAGLTSKRSFFGWQHLINQTKPDPHHEFFISLPIFHLDAWSTQFQTLSKWFLNQAMLVINPTDGIFMIAKVHDIFFEPSNKYQFGGSPQLIRAGKFWSPQNMGKVIVFFVTDENQAVKPGKLKFA